MMTYEEIQSRLQAMDTVVNMTDAEQEYRRMGKMLEELEQISKSVMEEREMVKKKAVLVKQTMDKVSGAYEALRRVRTMSNSELSALQQIMSSTSIPSEESVGGIQSV